MLPRDCKAYCTVQRVTRSSVLCLEPSQLPPLLVAYIPSVKSRTPVLMAVASMHWMVVVVHTVQRVTRSSVLCLEPSQLPPLLVAYIPSVKSRTPVLMAVASMHWMVVVVHTVQRVTRSSVLCLEPSQLPLVLECCRCRPGCSFCWGDGNGAAGRRGPNRDGDGDVGISIISNIMYRGCHCHGHGAGE